MLEDINPHIGLLLFEIHIPRARSLKDKRRVLSKIKDRVRARFNVSIAEVAYLDKWQRAVCGVIMIGTEKPDIDAKLQAILRQLEPISEAQLTMSNLEFL